MDPSSERKKLLFFLVRLLIFFSFLNLILAELIVLGKNYQRCAWYLYAAEDLCKIKILHYAKEIKHLSFSKYSFHRLFPEWVAMLNNEHIFFFTLLKDPDYLHFICPFLTVRHQIFGKRWRNTRLLEFGISLTFNCWMWRAFEFQ